jgi:protein-S-isoprenylcysteine O-methyltransferase Ste14
MNDLLSTEVGARVRFPPPLVFLSGILLGVVCRYAVAPARLPMDPTIRIIVGLLVSLAGVALIVWANVFFTRTGQDPIPWKPTPELIFQGPYRFTRNPMYVGMTLIALGFGIVLNNLWIVLFALPGLLIVHVIAVLPEERYLSEKFGEDYTQYRTQVRRYL